MHNHRGDHISPEAPKTGGAIRVQRKALLYKTLAILWIVPSVTSVFVILYRFPKGDSFLKTLPLVRLEQWLSLLLLLLHPFFIFRAWHYRRTETATEVVPASEEPAGE